MSRSWDALILSQYASSIRFDGHLHFCVGLAIYKFCPGCLLTETKTEININRSETVTGTL